MDYSDTEVKHLLSSFEYWSRVTLLTVMDLRAAINAADPFKPGSSLQGNPPSLPDSLQGDLSPEARQHLPR